MKELLDQMVDVLLPEMSDAAARKALIESALVGSVVLQKLQWEGAALPFTRHVVTTLAEFGEIAPGRLALTALLEEVRKQVGGKHQTRIDELLPQVEAAFASVTTPSGSPALIEFHQSRIAEWKQKRYALEKRFVNLTLTLDKGDEVQRAEDLRFDDLREVLAKTSEHCARVLLGAPGSGKSTLLRRLQYDHSQDWLAGKSTVLNQQVSFFVPLNGYRPNAKGELPSPCEWLNERWKTSHRQMPPLDEWLQEGRVLLLLDALNEMPHHSDGSYFDLIESWRVFAEEAAAQGNQLVFTCRRQDYGLALHVPVVQVQEMTPEQVRLFLQAYLPQHETHVWRELSQSPKLLELYQRPYFLRLLCEQVTLTGGEIPQSRAELFTGFVRHALQEEIRKNSDLLRPCELLTEEDFLLLNGAQKYAGTFGLPEEGALIPKLSELAFQMQQQGAQVRLAKKQARELLAHERAGTILKLGLSLNVLDDDSAGVAFFHQLLQEYFAARQLAVKPNPALVRAEWEADRIHPPLAEVIAGLKRLEWLPALKQTGWEETTLTAAPMAADPSGFIRALMPHNLPLAARCAVAAESRLGNELKREIQTALLERMRNPQAEVRARIAAGEALGLLGDPRFELHDGKHGRYLLPPLATIPAGRYTIGNDNGKYGDEKPQCEVELPEFQIGRFPITNAEYKLFIEAGGYKDEGWWQTQQARAWLRKQEDHQPSRWNDAESNNPLQPVVGVSWFEACAYCCWLTAMAANGDVFRLPTEAEFEAAARGKQARLYPYGDEFDADRCNTREGHVGRTTPVGIFDNATPEGVFDLSGNAWTWTLSLYKDYPYRSEDGREKLSATGSRVLRGGSWFFNPLFARAVYRLDFLPADRYGNSGFRLVVLRPPSS
ncbi:MAG TPA: SUMF1/EgtB/PvdO family nonheme iron enzyme [Blastocatellia bacterium]|nr:SUMF1/EgtB/PvdO family nonheme iron enzyme [Blastocatellia bacterium]HNG32768.1 SUMF1/EgtB/PvdO family nonheme iron enzyme [Blastocatellia bacterium]